MICSCTSDLREIFTCQYAVIFYNANVETSELGTLKVVGDNEPGLRKYCSITYDQYENNDDFHVEPFQNFHVGCLLVFFFARLLQKSTQKHL
jgi:hypothetical protein